MRPQPGNRFRFRLRARVVRASEAVRDDSALAGGRQTFFSSCCCSCCCFCCSGGRTSRDVPSIKTIEGYLTLIKQSVKKRPVFPVKSFARPRAPKYYFLYLKMHFFKKVHFQIQKTTFCIRGFAGRLAEVVCDKLSFREARGASMR